MSRLYMELVIGNENYLKKGNPRDISFTCTPSRDPQEVGGKFCIYVGPLFEENDHDPMTFSYVFSLLHFY